MRRARRRELLHNNPTPLEFISWLDTIGYLAPDHLREAVLRRNREANDLRTKFAELIDKLREGGLITAESKNKILSISDKNSNSNQSSKEFDRIEFHRQEKRYLYGFVAAFAEQNGYKADGQVVDLEPLAERLRKIGLNKIAAATMRKYINEAYSRYGEKIKNNK